MSPMTWSEAVAAVTGPRIAPLLAPLGLRALRGLRPIRPNVTDSTVVPRQRCPVPPK